MMPLLRDLIHAGLFGVTMLSAAMLGLVAAGHFPGERRAQDIARGGGPLILWSAMATTAVAFGIAVASAVTLLPWSYLVVSASLAVLFAPLALQQFPDRFVDGRSGLVALAASTAALTGVVWHAAG